jgi:hypothetical protein
MLWKQIMAEVDTNNDNLISHAEFFASMQAVLEQRSSIL